MWKACGTETNSFVASHLTRQCHIAGKAHIAKQKAKKEAVAKQKDEEVVAMQRVSTLRQPTLGHVVSYHAERFAVQDDLVFTMLASRIPVEKLDHPIMRAFLRKYTSVSGCLDELMQKRPSGTLIRLSFVTDHTTCLMKCLNFAQGEGPTACYMYDKLMDVVQDWKDTLQQAKLSPRIEDSLKVFKNGDNLRTRLLSIVQEMATALDERLVKEGVQLEFFRQVRVLNPANLPDMSKSLAYYPLLGLETFPMCKTNGTSIHV